MTIEVDAPYSENEVSQRAMISRLQAQLHSAVTGRDMFIKAYGELIDGLATGTIDLAQYGLSPLMSAASDASYWEDRIRSVEAQLSDAQSTNAGLEDTIEQMRATAHEKARELSSYRRHIKAVLDRLSAEKETMKSQHEANVSNIHRLHSSAIDDLKGVHESEIASIKRDHEDELSGLRSDAERERLAAEKKFSDMVADYDAKIRKTQAEHEGQLARERQAAQEREEELKEDYRKLEETIPGLIKEATLEGRSVGLTLAQSVVESANSLGLDSLSSPALSSIRAVSAVAQ